MKHSAIVLCLVSAGLAGCTAMEPDPFLTASVAAPQAPTIASEVAPGYAVAMLPVTAGGIRTVRQTVRKDYLQQTIVYGNTERGFGENAITVEVGRPDLDAAYLSAPSRRQIHAEMRAALPNLPMQIRSLSGQNVQGPFGYATAAYGPTGSCLYGWQYVKPAMGNPLAAVATGKRGYRLQVRVRFCHPTMPEERIGTLMDGLRVRPVSAETMSMLEFASGSGALAAVQPLAEPAVSQPAPKPVMRRVTAKAPKAETFRPEDLNSVVLPITRKQPPAGALYVDGASPVVIPNAARVPLPASGAMPMAIPTDAPIDATTTAARPVAAVTVPVPAVTLGTR